MTDLSPSIAPEMNAARLGPEASLDLVGHLGAALIQSDKIADPTVVDHLQSAHRLALDLYTSSGGSHRYRPIEAYVRTIPAPLPTSRRAALLQTSCSPEPAAIRRLLVKRRVPLIRKSGDSCRRFPSNVVVENKEPDSG